MTRDEASSGLLLYCITNHEVADPAAGPDLAGAGGRPVVVLRAGELALWTEAVERPVEPTPQSILAHKAVVDRAWRTRTACLPVRYGQWFPSPGDAVAAIEERFDPLVEALERVENAVEYELRVECRGPEDAAPRAMVDESAAGGTDPPGDADRSRGRAYMEALRRRQARAREADGRREETLRTLEALVEDLVRARRPDSRPDGSSVAHLLARSVEARYVERFRTARRPGPDVNVRLKGPWPPWSFGA